VNDFDARAMYAAMDAERAARGLSWPQVAKAVWAQSAALNDLRRDHPISPATLTGIGERGDCSCQHALFVLRWLDRTPEAFLVARSTTDATRLPRVGEGERLRWNLGAVYTAMNARREERGMTWRQLAAELRCTEHQLRGLRTARFAIGMGLMMRIVQWLGQPAAAYIYAARW
jgi:hypothetical protein